MRELRVAEHFADLETQHHTARVGMWVFVASEVMLFAGLFALYGAYYAKYPEQFHAAAQHNTLYWGTANTFVLITSSLTVALAIWATRERKPRLAEALLIATIALGLAFLGIKGWEYFVHAREGLLPGRYFNSHALAGPGAIIFYTLYWFMTFLHAVHMTVGIGIIVWLTTEVHRRKLSAEHHISLELGGLYWHLIDIIWIFLWPLLYLVR
jgi:cytochrome c oxidase subunit III